MKRKLATIKQLAADSCFTEGQIRWWLFHAGSNGLEDHNAIVRVGRRVYIDVDRFEAWIDSQQQPTALVARV